MRIDQVRVTRVAPGEDGASWTHAIADAQLWDSATVLKDEPGSSWVRRGRVCGRDVVIKARFLNTWSRRAKAAARMGHADKQWRGAARLHRAGLLTATPIWQGLALCDGVACELLVLPYLEGPTLLELLLAASRGKGPSVARQHSIARAVGRTVPALLRARLWNRDHKPSNLIVMDADTEVPRIAIIDCVGIKKYGWFGIDESEGEHMAASLVTEPLGCGCPPRRALWMVGFRAMMDADARAADRESRHADMRVLLDDILPLIPTAADARPRVDPLSGMVGSRSDARATGRRAP